MTSSAFLSQMLTSGGDRRIAVPRGGNTNVYGASPFPRSTLGYAASTANDISLDAFRHLEAVVAGWKHGQVLDETAYQDSLETLRCRIRSVWGLGDGIDVVFAPSGTDLELVALALTISRSDRAVTNILLGQDEVGSGCVLAAAGQYFAGETAVASGLCKGSRIAGFEDVELLSLPVRDENGAPVSSDWMTTAIGAVVEAVNDRGGAPLVHVVHGSKTGLVLPDLDGIDRLLAGFGDRLSLVVDACQARIEADRLHAYLDRQAIVLLTGSKFMGGPPFSGFALIPAGCRPKNMIAAGLGSLFRRAEWPASWDACNHLPGGANPGLLLRLEAALFELERYQALAPADRARVIERFGGAVRSLSARLGVDLVAPALAGGSLHQATLATLDLSQLPARPDLEMAQRWCRVLAARGLRLGQPVKCLRAADDRWVGTLRLSLSMPLICALARLDAAALEARFARDMARIADVLEAAQRPVVA